jgi:hypothetical protein
MMVYIPMQRLDFDINYADFQVRGKSPISSITLLKFNTAKPAIMNA